MLEKEDEEDDLTIYHLKTLARSLPAQGGQVMHIPAQRQRPARDAFVQVNWSPVRIQPPTSVAKGDQTEVKAWIVRVWEPAPPPDREALEWLLVTTVAINCTQDAWERVKWYKWRWFMEDFHRVLKTGCRIEVRKQQTVEAMCNLLGILTPMAMRLLWLRQTAQTAPDTPATEVVSPHVIYVVTQLAKLPQIIMTARDLWRTIASFGGYLNRKSDGPPGWQTLWKGWLYVQTVLEGVSLALRHPPPNFV